MGGRGSESFAEGWFTIAVEIRTDGPKNKSDVDTVWDAVSNRLSYKGAFGSLHFKGIGIHSIK
jgi:hypothetical protein